ncbi:MAG: DUF3793 family protein [Alkaliphilus sp.]
MKNLAYCEDRLEEQVRGVAHYIDNCGVSSENLLFLVDRIGATIAGVKPAELLNLPSKYNCNNLSWEKCQECILKNSNIKIRVIDKHKGRRHVFYYHEEALKNILSQTEVLLMLKGLDYPEEFSLQGYLDHLVRKMNSDIFPHEIGIFLGYPLKDVVGYMGIKNSKLVDRKGWQVYGDKEISQKRQESFLKARIKVRECLSSFERANTVSTH